MSLGETIYSLRKQSGLSQEQLSELMDVSRQTVSKWENNTVVPNNENISRLSEIFNCGEVLKACICKTEIAVAKKQDKARFTPERKLFLVIISLLVLSLIIADVIIGIIALPNLWKDKREVVSFYIDPSVFWILLGVTFTVIAIEIYAVVLFKKHTERSEK